MESSGSNLGPSPGPFPAHSPSFNEYSSDTIADIAARVVAENDVVVEETEPESLEVEEEEEEEDDSSFEFPVQFSEDNFEISPRFPVFNTDLVFADTDWRESFGFRALDLGENRDSESAVPIRIPLKMLMISERERETESASCSSSEADDLEGLAPESYCVWNPAKEEMRRKSKSTGYSKRWKIRDLMYRSHSDGAEAFVGLPPKQHHFQKKQSETKKEVYRKSSATVDDRRRTYAAPLSKDSVGFFAKMNELSKTIQPF